MDSQYYRCGPELQCRIISFAARRLFRDGVELSDSGFRVQPYEPGALKFQFERDRKNVSRAVAHFVRRNEAFSMDIFPPLWSAKLVAIGEQGLRLDGWESTGDNYQRQAWHIVYV